MTSQDQVAKLQLPNPSEIDDPNEDASSTSTTKIKGHVSRVAITNSREDLNSSQHTEYISPVQPILQSDSNADAVDNLRKKSVTKINIGTMFTGFGQGIVLYDFPLSPVVRARARDSHISGVLLY